MLGRIHFERLLFYQNCLSWGVLWVLKVKYFLDHMWLGKLWQMVRGMVCNGFRVCVERLREFGFGSQKGTWIVKGQAVSGGGASMIAVFAARGTAADGGHWREALRKQGRHLKEGLVKLRREFVGWSSSNWGFACESVCLCQRGDSLSLVMSCNCECRIYLEWLMSKDVWIVNEFRWVNSQWREKINELCGEQVILREQAPEVGNKHAKWGLSEYLVLEA